MAMESSRWEWNDITSTRSLWTITFSDESGHSVEAIERASLDAKPAELALYFGEVGPFTRTYRVRFPLAFADGTPLLGPGTRLAVVRFAGPLGVAKLVWRQR